MKVNRPTYIDNNGFERYEDNCKIVVGGAHDNPEFNHVIDEMHRIFAPKKARTNENTDYEGLILARAESCGRFDL